MQNELWEKNEVRLFKLTSGSDEFAVVLTDDYVAHVKSKMVEANTKIVGGTFVNSGLGLLRGRLCEF